MKPNGKWMLALLLTVPVTVLAQSADQSDPSTTPAPATKGKHVMKRTPKGSDDSNLAQGSGQSTSAPAPKNQSDDSKSTGVASGKSYAKTTPSDDTHMAGTPGASTTPAMSTTPQPNTTRRARRTPQSVTPGSMTTPLPN